MEPITDKIIVAKDGAIGRLTLNQPERRNAITYEMWQAIPVVLADFMADTTIRVIVVDGAGGKAFSAGADVSQFGDKRTGEDAVAAYARAVETACMDLATVAKPTIAKIEGFCIGGGISVAQRCDIRIAAEGATFGIPAAKLGIGYKYEGVAALIDLVGPAYAKEILFTARMFDASEALAMGLVNRVVGAAELAECVDDTAATIAANAPLTVRAAKTVVTEALKPPAERDMDLCQRLVDACYASADYVEGKAAFKEKRKPVFRGE